MLMPPVAIPMAPLRSRPLPELHPKEQLDCLQRATLDILESVGVRFPPEKAPALLAHVGARVDKATRVVTFPPDLATRGSTTGTSGCRRSSTASCTIAGMPMGR